MKQWYDKCARQRSFKPGNKSLVLLLIPGNILQAHCSGPYCVEEKLSDVNYIIGTPDRCWQQRLCRINMLKQYHSPQELLPTTKVVGTVHSVRKTFKREDISQCKPRLKNSDILENLEEKFYHLPSGVT